MIRRDHRVPSLPIMRATRKSVLEGMLLLLEKKLKQKQNILGEFSTEKLEIQRHLESPRLRAP